MRRLTFFLSFLALTAFSACRQTQTNRDFPDFHFMDSDSVVVDNNTIPADSALLLVYFRSDCEHCHHAALTIKQNIQQYPLTVWMVTGEEMDMMRMFEDMSGLYEIPNLRMLRDYRHEMHTLYDFKALPFILLFDKTGKEIGHFEELPTPETVRKLLAEE